MQPLSPDNNNNLTPTRDKPESSSELGNGVSSREVRRLRERQADGSFLGAGGKLYPPGTPLELIEPVLPDNGAAVIDRVVQVNGIMTDLERHLGDMQALANTGASVIGIHNSTDGLGGDIREYFSDKMRIGQSQPVTTLAELIYAAVSKGEELHLVGHSQGALMVSRALAIVHRRLCQEQWIDSESSSRAFEHLKIETYGGGAHEYIDGPQYVHVDNHLDPVPQLFGLGKLASALNWRSHPGRGAVQHQLADYNSQWREILLNCFNDKGPWLIDKLVHGPRTIYFPLRVPFEQARRGDFTKQDTPPSPEA